MITDPVELAWTRTDYAAHAVDRLLTARMPPGETWAAIRRVLRAHAGMDPPATAAGAAQVVAWLLRHRPGSFTAFLAAVTGVPARAPTVEGTEREYRLSGAESIALRVLDIDTLRGWERTAILAAGAMAAATVRLRVVPARIGGWDGEAFTRIRAGEPCGAVIPGLVRAGRSAQSWWPTWPPVTAHAVLQAAAGGPFGFADEQVTPDLIRYLAGL